MSKDNQKLSEIINSIFSTSREETSVGELVTELDNHGMAIVLILFSIPSALPIPAAGYSTLLAIPLFFIGARIIAGYNTVWLPEFLLKKKFSPAKLSQAKDKMLKLTSFMEKFTKPRLNYVVQSKVSFRLIGLLILLLACSMLLPIPGTNTAPAFAVFILGFGLLEKDGFIIIAGLLASVVALCISLAIIFFGRGMMTPEISYTSEMTVDKPAKEVGAVMTDASKLPQWIEGFKRAEHVSGTANTVGAVSHNYIDNGGEEMMMTETITAIQPMKKIAMDFSMDMMDMEYEMNLTEKDGKTIIRSETITKGNGLFLQSLFSFSQGGMQAQEDNNMASLKKLVEENTTDYFPETVLESSGVVVEQ